MLTYNDEILITKHVDGKLHVGLLETTHILKSQSDEHVVKGHRILDVNITKLNCNDVENIRTTYGMMFNHDIYPLSDVLTDLDKVVNGQLILSMTETPNGGVTLNIANGDVFSYFQANDCNVLPNLLASRTNYNQRLAR